MFVDEAEIYVQAGSGGHGCVSFRREKFVPKGGPDGGDGGNGGSIIFEVDPQMNTLLVFAGKHHWEAENGRPGEGSNRTGRSGRNRIIRVPPGTVIFDREKQLRLKELTADGQQVILIKGGRGGAGNRHFVSSTNQAPRRAQPGMPGASRWLRLELKLIADVGLIGLPNAGKSTLLSRCTRARPKIADYPFTTLEPQLGIVELAGFREFVMADIPGLIEGAHEGHGLGDRFLRHIERTKILLHLLDISPLEGQPAPIAAYRTVRQELAKYSDALHNKPELVVANKMDLTDSDAHLDKLREQLDCGVLPISAVTGAGLEQLTRRIWMQLEESRCGT